MAYCKNPNCLNMVDYEGDYCSPECAGKDTDQRGYLTKNDGQRMTRDQRRKINNAKQRHNDD